MSHVSANDLYLSILTDGRMYDQCVTAARLTAPKARAAAFERIVKTGWTNYQRDVAPSIIHSADMISAARMLESDRVAHVAEFPAPETVHYGLTRDELANRRAVHPSTLDNRNTPACGNGSYHAKLTRNKNEVTCDACKARI